MRKYLIGVIMLLLLVCGCSNINNLSYNEIVSNSLNNKAKANTALKGYKIYLPLDMSLLNDENGNNVLYSFGDKYYLYVDLVSYYNKVSNNYKVNDDSNAIYSEILGNDGYVLVTQYNNEYFIEVMYNYAKIEVISSDIKNAISRSLVVLNSISYNDNVIETLLGNSIDYNEEKFELLGPSVNTENFLKYEEDYGTYEDDGKAPDEDKIEIKPKEYRCDYEVN